MENAARFLTLPMRIALALFAIYAAITVPSLLPRWGASPAGLALLCGWLALAAIAWPIAKGTLHRGFWPALVAVVFVLRLAALAIVEGRVPTGDPAIYPELARGLLAGHGLIFHDTLARTSFVALYPPVYPLLLAGLGGVLGFGQGTIWASNVVLDLAAALLVARIGAALGSPAAGRAGAWLCAIWPTFVLAAPLAQKEPLVLVLVLGIVLLLLGLRTRTPGRRDGAALGAACGLLALTQPGLAFFPGLLGLALLPAIGWRRLFAAGWRALPVAVAVMLPWWVRNALLLGHFVPLTSTGGIGLWIGNNPEATGNWMAMPAAWAGMDEIAVSARAAAEAKAWMIAHPIDCAKLTMTKLVRTMGVEQFTALRFSLLRPAPAAALNAALFPPCQGALFALLALGAAAGGTPRRAAGGATVVLLVAACLAQIGLFGVWFEFGERHRYFLMPFLFLLGGLALAALRVPAGARARVVQPA